MANLLAHGHVPAIPRPATPNRTTPLPVRCWPADSWLTSTRRADPARYSRLDIALVQLEVTGEKGATHSG